MVTLGSRRIHLALTDSRGIGVGDKILELNKSQEYFELRPYRGAVFEDLVETALGYLKNHQLDVVYIAGGVNNITLKDQKNKLIHYQWGAGEELADHLVKILKWADGALSTSYPASRVVFCPLVGCELSRVVSAHPTTDDEQKAVDEAVWAFNELVFEINRRRNTYCPPLHHQVHRFCKGKKRVYYHHLADGIHLTCLLKTKWAQNFVHAMAQN